MKKQKVNFPKMDDITVENYVEYLPTFYRAIGWDGQCDLNPKRISINRDRWIEICGAFNSTEESGAGFAWMNWGPTADEDTPYDKVIIHKEAFTQPQNI
ncbi:hypothetical protein COA18_05195 [Priestia megaterium]|nr:hypothetical protein COA18_05195 [Priestia megaterium]